TPKRDYIMREWYIKCTAAALDSTTAALTVSQLQKTLISQAMDRCTFVHNTGDMTADLLFPYKSTVEIYYKDDGGAAVTWFIGRSNTVPRTGNPDAEYVQYEILGSWYYLTRTEYHQNWKMSQGAEPVWTRSARVILGQAEDGTRTTTGNQIKEALQYGITERSLSLQLPADTSGWPDIEVPFDLTKDLYISDVINRLLQYTPDCGTYIDYSTTPPTFHIYKRAAAAAINISLTGEDTQSITITPRHDLVPAGIVVHYDSTNTIDDNEWISQDTETAGDPDDFDTQTVTIELEGYNLSYQVHKVYTEDWPSAWTDKAWWKKQDQSIEAIADADITFGTPTTDYPGGLAALIADYPKILIGDGIPEWLESRAESIEDTINIPADLTKQKRGGGAPDKTTETLAANITATKAVTGIDNKRRYSKLESGDGGEIKPAGLATKLYASWSQLQYQGSLTKEEIEVSGSIYPGNRLNITNGRPEWATMNALIQTVTESADDGITAIQFGPADHISPDDLASLLGRCRRIIAPGGYMNARKTGEKGDLDKNAETGGKPAKANTTSKTTEYKEQYYTTGTSPNIRQISNNPNEMPDDKGNLDITPREIYTIENPDSSSRDIQKRQIMASEAYGAPIDWPGSGDLLTDELIYKHSSSYETCKPKTDAGKYWTLVHVAVAAAEFDGHTVPEGKRQYFMQQFCVPLYEQSGYCTYSTPAGENLTFIDANGDTQTQSVTDGVMATYTGTIEGTNPATGDAVSATFIDGVSTDYEGQISLTNDTTGDSETVRIDSDGKLKQ
ncbi:MAG: hypothetical protein DRI57_29615, partial [Deltaproteobacteria bacterium]